MLDFYISTINTPEMEGGWEWGEIREMGRAWGWWLSHLPYQMYLLLVDNLSTLAGPMQ